MITWTQAKQLGGAYEVRPDEVAVDADTVQGWTTSLADLCAHFEARHRWTPASKNAAYYASALQEALAEAQKPAAPR